MKPYDPKLREAAEEFKALCRKYDCAGFVLFVSPTHSEFVNQFSPSWSVMQPDGSDSIRFRAMRHDFVSRESQEAAIRSSAHVLASVLEWTRMTNGAFRGVLEQLSQHMRIVWRAWDGPTSVPGDGQ